MNLQEIPIVINTTSKNNDVWKMFYSQIKAFSAACKFILWRCRNAEFVGQTFLYDKNLKFRSRIFKLYKSF